MSAKQIRRNLGRAIEKKGQLETELSTVQEGPRSLEDALAAVAEGSDIEAAEFCEDLMATLGGQPQKWGRTIKEREKPLPGPKVHLQAFRPSTFLGDVLRRKQVSLDATTSLLPPLALLGIKALREEIESALGKMPKSAFGMSQADRDKQEKELRREVKSLGKEIERLQAAWTEEVGDGIPAPV